MKIKLYKCNTCGNVIVKIIDSDMTPSCCGKQMSELRPEMTDGALEKHVPVAEKKGNVVCVRVGEEPHPMTDMHHIEFIILHTNKGFHVHYTYQSECDVCEPKACFYLVAGEEPLEVLEYCNLHGLYSSKSFTE